MTEPTNTTNTTEQEQQPQQGQPRMPDQLDLLALTLVGLQHQNQAMGGAIHTALLQVNLLLAARGQTVPAGAPGATQGGPRVMGRTDMGFAGSVPPAGVPGLPGVPGRPLPPHPDRTFGAARRREAEQAAAQQAAPAPAEVHDTTTTDRGHQ